MNNRRLKIAIISDLHCHPERKEYKDNNTLLFSDQLRSPHVEHPVQNLLEIIDNEKLKVDLVLSPGDFTDGSDRQGLLSGWNYVTEISRALGCNGEVIATIGNHDIDSRHIYSKYSFDIPKKIKQNFPLKKDQLGTFWDAGYTFIEEDQLQILVLNSTHYHTHFEKGNSDPIENPAVKGKIDSAQIEEIEKYLKEHPTDKIKIALCHHHPIDHSRLKLGHYDFIENGGQLLTVLANTRFDLVVHGHKHDPWIRYHNCSGYNLPILSSGSFAATNQMSWISKFNYFHIVDIEKVSDGQCTGIIDTWTFKRGQGWENKQKDGFYPHTGFGYKGDIIHLKERIKSIVMQGDILKKWQTIVDLVPEVQYLMPEEMEELKRILETDRIHINCEIGVKPKHIYYES